MPRWPNKHVTLISDPRAGNVLFIEIVVKDCITWKDHYDIRISWRDTALATCSRSQPLLNMNIGDNFQVTFWRHRWRHHHENAFSGMIWDGHLISDAKLKLPFWGRGKHLNWKLNMNRSLNMPARYPCTCPTFWVFDRCSSWNINGDMAVHMFDLFWGLIYAQQL